MEKYEVERLLPRVGDVRMEVLTVDKHSGIDEAGVPQRCIVVEVNRSNLWYRVRFESGFIECYKLPKPKIGPNGGILR